MDGGFYSQRRTIPPNNDRDIEMRPLRKSPTGTSTTSSTSSTSSAQQLIDRLRSNAGWDPRTRFSNSRNKKRNKKSRFAVDIPPRLIFHLIIVFFLIPLTLGMLFVIKALVFGLKEDEQHPLHKKLPQSHHVVKHLTLDEHGVNVDSIGDVGDDMTDKGAVLNVGNLKGSLVHKSLNETLTDMENKIDEQDTVNSKTIIDEMELEDAAVTSDVNKAIPNEVGLNEKTDTKGK
jgi:hypothetical protein